MGKRNDEEAVCGCKSPCKGVEVPSDDELVALNAMRSIRDKARAIRERMDRPEGNEAAAEGSEQARMRRELEDLKMEWEVWKKKRDGAARERMILLGHEEPDPE